VTKWRWALVATAAVLAALAALAAHDVRAWKDALADGDARFAAEPARAEWTAATWLPGDPAGRLLHTGDDVGLRRAVQAFVVADARRAEFDGGERRAADRAAAEVALAGVAATGSARQASQANDLLGVLFNTGGRLTGGETASERSLAAFDAAVRADPSNTDAKYNLELLLRRLRAIGVRRGPGQGSGAATGRRGAGSGTPGRGY
jgi:hypothetical protein